MKKLSVALLLSCMSAMAFPALALALDVPAGGDALFHQVRSARAIGVGILVKSANRESLTFKSVQSVEGKLPENLVVPSDPYVETLKLAPGKTYTLFLVPSREKKAAPGAEEYGFAVSMYSVVETPPRDVAAFKEAITVFRKAESDKPGARAPLLKMLNEAKLPYLQYSAAQGLGKLRLLTKDDIPALRKLILRPAVDPRAQETLVHEAARLDGLDQRTLESLVANAKVPIALKSFAIDELFRTKGADGLKPVLKHIDKARSPRLQAQVGKLLSKQKTPPDDADK